MKKPIKPCGQKEGRDTRAKAYEAFSGAKRADFADIPQTSVESLEVAAEREVSYIRKVLESGTAYVHCSIGDANVRKAVIAKLTEDEKERVHFSTLDT